MFRKSFMCLSQRVGAVACNNDSTETSKGKIQHR